MKTKLITLLLTLSLLFALTACGAPAPGGSAPVSADPAVSQPSSDEPPISVPDEPAVFTDDLGRQVELPPEIDRIVPSAPLAQYILYAIAPDLFVGLAGRWDSSAGEFLPKEHLALPYLGQLYSSADLNVEELALAAPDLIIDIGETKKSSAEDLDALQSQTGIPTVFISTALDTMPDTFRKLGKLLNREEKGEELASFCEAVYSRTLPIMEQVGDNKVNCLFVLGEEGLNVLATGSYHAELPDLLANNLAVVDNPVSKGTGNAVTMEQIALWNPDFVIFAPGSIYDRVEDMATWDHITAIANGDYVEVPDAPLNWTGMPPSVQRYLGLIWLTAVLYPEYCDYDVQAEVTEFYRLFYGCAITDEQYAAITTHAFPEG